MVEQKLGLSTKQVKKDLGQTINDEMFHIEKVSEHFVDRISERNLDYEEIKDQITKSFRRNRKVIYQRFKECDHVDINVFNQKFECVIQLRKGDRSVNNDHGEKLLLTFITAYRYNASKLNRLKNRKGCFC